MEYREVDWNILSEIYKERERNVRKKNFGNLLIIGGSKIYPSTPALVGLSAYRAGADWVVIASPEKSSYIISSYDPNLMIYPLKGDLITRENVDELLKISEKRDAIEIGGGITRNDEQLLAIKEYLEKINVPVVIDDDAIYSISKYKLFKENFVITCNSYEFYVLSGEKIGYDLNERIERAYKFAKENKVTLLLKGHYDIITDGEEIYVNKKPEITKYMTKAGLGNTLAGILLAYLGRKVNKLIASSAAAFVNGKAGEFAIKKYDEGFTPLDLINEIPNVIKKFKRMV